jgi:outer membrane lipopolysaccharide assembly protein LptE/RlpB
MTPWLGALRFSSAPGPARNRAAARILTPPGAPGLRGIFHPARILGPCLRRGSAFILVPSLRSCRSSAPGPFRRRSLAFLPLLLLFLLSAACGYRLRGTGTFLPPDVRTLSVPVFKNQTTRYELDVKLTRAVIDEMVARGKVKIVADPSAADAVLEGEVVSFVANPIAFDAQSRADNYNVMVTAKITLTGRADGRVIFSNPAFVYNQAYAVPQGRDFESVQTEALDAIAGKFARSLVATILEGF